MRKTAGGFPAIDEIPEEVFRMHVLTCVRVQGNRPCRAEHLPQQVFKCAGFHYKARNRVMAYQRISLAIDGLLSEGALKEVVTGKTVRVVLG